MVLAVVVVVNSLPPPSPPSFLNYSLPVAVVLVAVVVAVVFISVVNYSLPLSYLGTLCSGCGRKK